MDAGAVLLRKTTSEPHVAASGIQIGRVISICIGGLARRNNVTIIPRIYIYSKIAGAKGNPINDVRGARILRAHAGCWRERSRAGAADVDIRSVIAIEVTMVTHNLI